jgi:hypothetical protein
VLLESHHDKPELVRRFVEEAQIGGQLQHPGIVPVYELGAFADRRPYFTMKLVPPGRRLRPGLDPVRDPHRPASLYGAKRARGDPQGDAGRHGRCAGAAGRLRGRG